MSRTIKQTDSIQVIESMTGSRSRPYSITVIACGIRTERAGTSWADASALAYRDAMTAVAALASKGDADGLALRAYMELREIG